jgi:hypothetical protein
MKIILFLYPFLTGLFLIIVPLTTFAQETKKEVHIKITENGVVTKDTVYKTSGEISELEHITQMEMHHSDMGKKHVEEKHIIVMSGVEKDEMTWEQKCGDHKEVKVVIHDGDGHHHMSPVEEIWIGGAEDGRPCHTIIIHEGNCPEGHMKMDEEIMEEHIVPPPSPMIPGEKPVEVKRKVIITEEGEKVIIVETTVDENDTAKGKKKK